MWVWSDELAARVSLDGVDLRERLPLVAYAVGSETDLDELAVEVLGGTRAEPAEPPSALRGIGDR